MKCIRTKYCVVEDFTVQTLVTGYDIRTRFFHLQTNGVLLVFAGFCWDGATDSLDTYSNMVSSCVHDIFCYLINRKLLPKELQARVDYEYIERSGRHKMPFWRQILDFIMIRIYQELIKPKHPGESFEVLEFPHEVPKY